MPSVDVIRNIKIQGSAPGVDDATAALNRLTESIKAANENISRTNQVANDNATGWRLTGEGALTAANHMRQAAEAAYAFSPAFRGVVNEMAAPALGVASTAIAAVAAGIVTATNYAGTGLIALAGAAEKASPSLLSYTSGVRSAGIAMEAFTPTVGAAASSILGFLSPALRFLGWAALAVKAIESVGEAWRLGGEKLAEYVALSEKATASGVTTDFFQGISKAATDAKLPVDALTAAFKTLNAATSDTLGGTSAQNRLNELQNSKNFNGATGNFVGNTGIADLAAANTTEEKFRAIVTLIDQAMQKGERLAALDVAKSFLGETVAQNLAKDSDYLNKMLASADKIKDEDLVSQSSIDNAVALQNRLDAAEKILSQRWHPIQDLLTAGGITMREVWVSIVEAIAAAFDWVSKLVIKLGELPKSIPKDFQDDLDRQINEQLKLEGLGGLAKVDPSEQALAAARLRLGSGLQNPANLASARDQVNTIQNKVFPDVSKDPNKKPVEEDTAAYDRAQESLLRYIETTKAASLAVSDAAGEQEKFKAIAQLTAAGIKDGLTPEAAKLKAEMSGLGEKAGAAADALAKAREVSNIGFASKTALLSQEDVAIATQLKGIYGTDVPAALNSTYAASIRVNNAFKEIGTAIETNLTSGLTDIVSGTKSVSKGFSDMGLAVVKAIEQMIVKIAIVQPLMAALQASASSLGFGGLSLGGAGVGNYGQTANASGLGAGTGGLSFPMFASGTDSAPGGWSIVGENGPELMKVPGGAQILPNGVTPGSGGTQVNVSVVNYGNDNVSVNQSKNGNGGVDLELVVGQAAANQMANRGSALRQVTDNRALLAAR